MRVSPGSSRPARAGFTLIELLAVILILGILTALLVTQLAGSEEAAQIQNTQRREAMLSAIIDSYANEYGDAPRSMFTSHQGVPNDGDNVGAEALFVALWSNQFEASGADELADDLVNTDGDSSARRLTDFESRELFEIPDDWGNPIAYFHRRDYDAGPQSYVTFDPVTGEELHSEAKALRNPKTGRFFRSGSYQLISAGPDGLFGTEDDITPFERK
ncbi:MAG TPA: type II secretion system protein [Planctomycetes bacterium]|nr:type II secretion system protein [Planctomycetota bacterium]